METQTYKKVSIYDEDFNVIVSAENISVNEGRLLLSGDGFPLIPHHTITEARGYTEDGVVPMKVEVTLSTEKQLNLDLIALSEQEERRAYLKVRTNIQATLLRSYSLGSQNRPMWRGESIQLRDISVGGLGIYADTVLLKDQKILLQLDAVAPGFTGEAIVLRRKKIGKGQQFRYRYGCRFLKLSHEQERALCEFVFKTQIENHKKMMEENRIQ